jgi:hypothetical protein
VGSEGRTKQDPAMPVLFKGIKLRESNLKSPFGFLQGFIKGLVSSGEEFKILIGEKTSCAAGSPNGTRSLDLF